MEHKLWHCLLTLTWLLDPNGIIMDAGANDGTTTRMLATRFVNHTIVSVEPILTNVKSIQEKTTALDNVELHHGGLGRRSGRDTYAANLDAQNGGFRVQTGAIGKYAWQANESKRAHFPVYTVDDLVGDRVLTLAHWDVEGHELALLHGANGTLHRSRPIVTIETFKKTDRANHDAVMAYLRHHAYKCVTVHEVCGRPRDCRNHVCLPSERAPGSWCNSP